MNNTIDKYALINAIEKEIKKESKSCLRYCELNPGDADSRKKDCIIRNDAFLTILSILKNL